MDKVVIIGGGFAGLSSAVFLLQKGYEVDIYEASPKLGGRAYSFIDERSGDCVDNGQHILMGCYKETLRFLKLIGAEKNLIYQSKLKVPFVDKEMGLVALEAGKIVYPFNLLNAIFRFGAIGIKEKFGIVKLFSKLFLLDTCDLKGLTVREWLWIEKQNEKAVKAFWEIICIGAMNTGLENASAEIFAGILKEIFFKGNKAATILLPEKGLTQMYCESACSFINNSGGKVFLSSKIDTIEINGNRVTEIRAGNKIISDFDYVVSSVPFHSLQKILPSEMSESFNKLENSPILNLHLWLTENRFTEKYYGLIDSKVHWVFNHKSYITITISDAGKLIEKSKEELFELVTNELIKYFSFFKKEQVLNYKVIKEKRATFIPSESSSDYRPSTKTNIENLLLAGDWINTGLPATIEGAVKSGRMAADEINHESII